MHTVKGNVWYGPYMHFLFCNMSWPRPEAPSHTRRQ